ncbi:MAG: hypothetical protein KGZ38_05345 [Erysipelothrix sp.]|nr:hypothetical protein [Erysipelothrix sp.]
MRLGNLKVEQVNELGLILDDFGEILTNNEMIEILSKHFTVVKIKQGVVKCTYNESTFIVFLKNVSYLGTPHPFYKKRIQIPAWFLSEYEHYSSNFPVFFLGIYKYQDNVVFVIFDNSKYLKNKANNSSAHIFTHDLRRATLEGYTYRKDIRGNILFAFNRNSISTFVSMFVTKTVISTPALYSEFEKFFQSLPVEWNGIECYMDMIEANFSRKYQPEWQSSYQEFMFEEAIKSKLVNEEIVSKHLNRGKDAIDLDLYFKPSDEYGDLKMHTIGSSAIIGNKTETILKCIENNRSVYYVVFEHTTKLDKDNDYTVTEFWNCTRDKTDLRSYSGRMKNSITLQNMLVLQINSENIRYLNADFQKDFTNSDGAGRTAKIAIPKKLINSFVVYSSLKNP